MTRSAAQAKVKRSLKAQTCCKLCCEYWIRINLYHFYSIPIDRSRRTESHTPIQKDLNILQKYYNRCKILKKQSLRILCVTKLLVPSKKFMKILYILKS
jgi:hypothetical protein